MHDVRQRRVKPNSISEVFNLIVVAGSFRFALRSCTPNKSLHIYVVYKYGESADAMRCK